TIARITSSRTSLGSRQCLGSQRGCPVATGGRSASLLTVFFPTCSPPLSRNTARATAISAPRMAPNLPLRALLSVIITSDHPSSCSQRLRPTEVPALQQGQFGTAAALWRPLQASTKSE